MNSSGKLSWKSCAAKGSYTQKSWKRQLVSLLYSNDQKRNCGSELGEDLSRTLSSLAGQQRSRETEARIDQQDWNSLRMTIPEGGVENNVCNDWRNNRMPLRVSWIRIVWKRKSRSWRKETGAGTVPTGGEIAPAWAGCERKTMKICLGPGATA